MPLNDVISSGNYLLSQAPDASAISEPRTQQLIDTDYRRCKSTRIRWYHGNIASFSSVADTLITAANVEVGDLLLIRQSDGNIADFIVPAVSAVQNADLIPTMVSKTLPYGIVTGTDADCLNAFDSNLGTHTYMNVNDHLTYQFHNNVPHVVHTFYYRSGTQWTTFDFLFQGSTNGLDYTTLLTIYNTGSGAEHSYTIPSPGAYSYYRMKGLGTQSYIYDIRLYGEGFEIDTSSVTAGSVPNPAWSHTNRVRFNETFLVENNRDYVYGESADRLHVYSQYDDCVFYPQREIVTTYDFKVAGNLMLEQTNQIFDLWLVQANVDHTANTSPANIVSVSGAQAPVASDAWKIFDGDVNTEGYNVATGVNGLVDITHTYTFDVPTRCYALEMTTSVFSQAPSKYYVEASMDGTTNWVQLLDVQQGIAADDLTLTKYFDGALYDTYKAYRLTVTEGNTANDFVTAKQYRLLQEDPNA